MTDDRAQILANLEEEFESWDVLLSGLSEEEAASSRLPNGWSVKDLTAHLTAWQNVTRARLRAAEHGQEPVYPQWLAGASPESEEDIHRFNARIYEAYRDQPWAQVHQAWRAGFLEVLKLGKEVPEGDLLNPERYPWLNGYPLIAVLQGTCEHHHLDHFKTLRTWVDQHAKTQW